MEDELVKYKKRARHKPKKKVDHKHIWEKVHIVQHSKRYSNVHIPHLGRRCTICGKLAYDKMYLFTSVPDYVKELELVEEDI